MFWTCIGAIKPKNNNPGFCIPVFDCPDDKRRWVQRISDSEKISEMLILPSMYLEKMELVPSKKKLNVSLGDDGLYSFFREKSEFFIECRHDLEERLENYVNSNVLSPIPRLSVVRFLRYSPVYEGEALDAVAALIENLNIRETFLAIEKQALHITEDGKVIDNLIKSLSESGSFSETHAIIERIMSMKDRFSSWHFRQAIRAACDNNQVYWISSDEDVRDFIKFIIGNADIKITDLIRSRLID